MENICERLNKLSPRDRLHFLELLDCVSQDRLWLEIRFHNPNVSRVMIANQLYSEIYQGDKSHQEERYYSDCQKT
jgi:hypothetical protein